METKINDTYSMVEYTGPPIPHDLKNQFDMLLNPNDHEEIIHGSCMEINFDVIKNGTLCKWTKDFLQYGIKLFPPHVQKKLTSDTTEIINQKKGFFKKTFPGGSLVFHTDPFFHGSMVYVIECNSNFKIQFKGKVYVVNDYGAGNIINLLPNTKHSVSYTHDNSGKNCSSEPMRVLAVCFF